MSNKKSELKVYVIVRGVKKRCRKSERRMLEMANAQLDASQDELKAKAVALIHETMKTVDKAELHLDYVEVADGFESWIMFDERHKTIPLTQWPDAIKCPA